jgi:hypothetical protein
MLDRRKRCPMYLLLIISTMAVDNLMKMSLHLSLLTDINIHTRPQLNLVCSIQSLTPHITTLCAVPFQPPCLYNGTILANITTRLFIIIGVVKYAQQKHKVYEPQCSKVQLSVITHLEPLNNPL